MKDLFFFIKYLWKEHTDGRFMIEYGLIIIMLLFMLYILVFLIIVFFGHLIFFVFVLSCLITRVIYILNKRRKILSSDDIDGIKFMVNTVLNDDLNVVTEDYNENTYKLLSLTIKFLLEKPYLLLFLPIHNSVLNHEKNFISADIFRKRLIDKFCKLQEPLDNKPLWEEVHNLYCAIDKLEIHKANYLKTALDVWAIQTLNTTIKTNSNVISEVAFMSLEEIIKKVTKAHLLEEEIKMDEINTYSSILNEEERKLYHYIKSL